MEQDLKVNRDDWNSRDSPKSNLVGSEWSTFCSACQGIDFQILAKLEVQSLRTPKAQPGGILVAQLGSRCVEPPTNSCALCKFFHDSIRDIDTSAEVLELWAFSFLRTYFFFKEIYGTARDLSVEQDLVCLQVLSPDKGPWFDKSQNQHIFIRDETDDRGHLFTPRILHGTANFGMAHDWLNYCRSHHPWCCVEPSSIVGLRLIDCQTFEVVQRHSEEYLALSYVWGRLVPEDTRPPEKPFPKTIMDAVFITKTLGFRYLWVDQYCINQNDHEEKHNQIQKMDVIYRNAVITIIAASGTNANSGLAGVQGTSRTRQPSLSVGDLTLINTMARPHHTISKSLWSTRGWTLQEAAVTTRRLVFTGEQMYFECLVMNCHESISYNLPELHRITRNWSRYQVHPAPALGTMDRRHDSGPNTQLTIDEQFHRFEYLRQQYTRRKLTYEMDSLNAFLGILGQFEIVHVWGVPYASSSRSLYLERSRLETFTYQLGWVHMNYNCGDQSTGSNRRSDFPSWSWVGWEGEVGEPRLPLSSDKPSLSHVEIDHLKLQYDSGTLTALADLPAKFTSSVNYPQPTTLHFEATVLEYHQVTIGDNTISMNGDSGTLYLSTGPHDGESVRRLLKSRRYLFVVLFRFNFPKYFCLLLLEDHGKYCSRVGAASLRIDPAMDEPEWWECCTYTRDIILM